MSKIRTIEAAAAAIAEIGAIDGKLARIQADLDREVAALKLRAETEAGPLNASRDLLAWKVKVFCDAKRSELVEGKNKFIDFPTGQAGWRLGQAKLEIDPTLEDAAIKAFERRKLRHCLRYSVTLDKRAILKDPVVIKGIDGLKIVPAEEAFWVKATALDLAEGPAAAAA